MRNTLVVVVLALSALLLTAVASADTTAPPVEPITTVLPDNSTSASDTQVMSNGDTATLTVGQVDLQLSPILGGTTLGTAGPCGSVGYYGKVKYTNYLGIVLWTYQQNLNYSFCRYNVTAVNSLYDQPLSSCCNWGWQGNVAKSHTAVGSASMTSYTKGHFANCVTNFCAHKYPWVQLQVNGTGKLTGFSWSTG